MRGKGTGEDAVKLWEKQQKVTVNLAHFRRKTGAQYHLVPVLETH